MRYAPRWKILLAILWRPASFAQSEITLILILIHKHDLLLRCTSNLPVKCCRECAIESHIKLFSSVLKIFSTLISLIKAQLEINGFKYNTNILFVRLQKLWFLYLQISILFPTAVMKASRKIRRGDKILTVQTIKLNLIEMSCSVWRCLSGPLLRQHVVLGNFSPGAHLQQHLASPWRH